MDTRQQVFEDLHEQYADPWQVDSRWYEKRKFAITVGCLPNKRYARVFEPGCSIGALTSILAARSDQLLAWDIASNALSQAAHRNLGDHVTFEQRAIPVDWPEAIFDLIVLSELGYYLTPFELAILVDKSVATLDERGHLVLVHWRGIIDGFELHSSLVHKAFEEREDLVKLVSYRDRWFLLDVFGHRSQPISELPF